MAMHQDELTVTTAMVRKLISKQFPAWASASVHRINTEGTVNAIFRLGKRLAARLPLQPGDIDAERQQLDTEAAAARELLAHTRLATPVPVAIGDPDADYPMPWSVQTWLPGKTATTHDIASSEAFASDLAGFIDEVRAIPTHTRTFTGNGRGGDLRSHDDWMKTCFERSAHFIDVNHARRLWSHLRTLPRHAPDAMTHGDLIPGNVLIREGRLAGVLDVGGLGAADPALDLVAGWHLLDSAPRRILREELECDDLGWERGKAWAFQQAMGALWYYADTNAAMHQMGRRTMDRILTEPNL